MPASLGKLMSFNGLNVQAASGWLPCWPPLPGLERTQRPVHAGVRNILFTNHRIGPSIVRKSYFLIASRSMVRAGTAILRRVTANTI